MQKKLEENNEKLAKKNTWGKEQYDEMKVKLEKESTQRRTTEDHLKDLMLQLKQQLRVRLVVLNLYSIHVSVCLVLLTACFIGMNKNVG